MTSNIGSHIIQENFENMTDEDSEAIEAKTKNQVFEVLKKSIRPEFLNRIDETIMFTPLTRDNIRGIVDLQFAHLQTMLGEQNIKITATDDALDWLAQLGYDPQFGARPLKRVMQKKVLNELSKQILAGKIANDSHIVLDMFDNQFVFRNEVAVEEEA
jgi:ATP-dependent Clp protease ATP-binding subunit ClpB